MSRIRANKITDKAGTGAIEIERGAWFPVGYGLTGAGGVNITGIVTATSFSGSGANLTGIDATAIKDSAGNVKIQAQASGAVYTGIHTFGTNSNFTDVDVNGHTNLDNVSIAGVTTFAGGITGTTATFSGSVSVGGTLTYEDVTNIDSVGIVTAREGIFLPDTKQIKLGNNATTPDFKIYHVPTENFIESPNGILNIKASNGSGGVISAIICRPSAEVELFYGGNQKLETTNTGVTVTGQVAATSFAGDGSGLSGISVGITTEALVKTNGQTASLDLTKDDHKVTATGTVTIDVTGGSEADSHTLRIVNSGITTVGFSTYFLFPSGGTPSLPTASGAISLISFTIHRAGAVGVSTQLMSGASINFS